MTVLQNLKMFHWECWSMAECLCKTLDIGGGGRAGERSKSGKGRSD